MMLAYMSLRSSALRHKSQLTWRIRYKHGSGSLGLWLFFECSNEPGARSQLLANAYYRQCLSGLMTLWLNHGPR
jgi:hypothetical protein